MNKTSQLLLAAALALAATGCSTWDKLSTREKGATIGASAGAVAGAVISNGGVLGTVGGAAIGGLIGHEVAK
ncbi:MAG: glycine zipper 2TM domain-containing protein [Rhodocyclaceae bacterium]|nr:glycine zipper 2TM domain-containing protein [Rhodocyclaceae bacterium]